jgi:chemotaxis receptor (MCP) glutamine deamidase CheD
MLINGQPLDNQGFDAVVAALQTLPSGFAKRNANITDIHYSQAAQTQIELGITAYRNGKRGDGALNLLEQAANYFLSAAQLSEQENNWAAASNSLARYGDIQIDLGNPENAIVAFEKASTFDDKYQYKDLLYFHLAALHRSIVIAANDKDSKGLNSEADSLRLMLRPLRKRSSDIHSEYKGEGIEPDAYRVEQREVGFSSKELMGTDNLRACICLIIRDPITHKTALAHIDAGADIESLELIFERLPKRIPPEQPLEAKIVGVSADTLSVGGDKTSQANLQKVINFLNKRHVEVISADIAQPDQQTSVIVDPETFNLDERSPGKNNFNKEIATAKSYLSLNKPLNLAFDLTSTDKRTAILLTRENISNIKYNYIGKTERQIYNQFSKDFNYGAHMPVLIEGMVSLAENYQKEVEWLEEKLLDKIVKLSRKGISFSDSEEQAILKVLSDCPIHVGKGAKNANRPLGEFIEYSLFDTKDMSVRVNLEGLQQFQFPPQPFEALESSENSRTYVLREEFKRAQKASKSQFIQ